jgi:hypothetical protein
MVLWHKNIQTENVLWISMMIITIPICALWSGAIIGLFLASENVQKEILNSYFIIRIAKKGISKFYSIIIMIIATSNCWSISNIIKLIMVDIGVFIISIFMFLYLFLAIIYISVKIEYVTGNVLLLILGWVSFVIPILGSGMTCIHMISLSNRCLYLDKQRLTTCSGSIMRWGMFKDIIILPKKGNCVHKDKKGIPNGWLGVVDEKEIKNQIKSYLITDNTFESVLNYLSNITDLYRGIYIQGSNECCECAALIASLCGCTIILGPVTDI